MAGAVFPARRARDLLGAGRRGSARRWAGSVAMLVALAGAAPGGRAQDEYEIAPFRLTGIEGAVTIRYDSNEQTNSSAGSAESRQKISELRGEVFVLTHSYVYHPDFLSMDLGAGPILSLDSFSSNAESRSDTEALYDLTARLNFLRQKPYPFSVFYEHLNPTVAIGPAETLILETTRYGASASLLQPLTPVPVTVEAVQFNTTGNSATRVVDDQLTQLTGRAYYTFAPQSQTQLVLQSVSGDSRNGSVGLPITTTHSDTTSANLDTRAVFGSRNQFDITNLITYTKQEFTVEGGAPVPTVEDTRFFLNGRWAYSDALQYYGNINWFSSDQQVQKTTGQAVTAGATYMVNPDLTARLQVNEAGFKTEPGASLNTWGAEGQLDYRKELPLGVLGLTYTAGYLSSDSKADAPQADVIGERIVLVGTAPVPLQRRNVIASTVVVSNLTRTQTYVEGLDYLLTVVGDVTRIQRLAGGNIFDGQEVLVDYSFQTQGTFSFTTWAHNVSATLRVMRYYELYARYRNISNSVKTGTPNFPLNDVNDWVFGARADVPLKWDIVVGGYAEWENDDETIAPFTRQSYNAYVEAPLPFGISSGLRVGAVRNVVDYQNAASQNVDLNGYDIRLWTRLQGGWSLSADYNDQRDTGGSLPQSRKYAALRADWAYRQLTFTLDASRQQESTGSTESTSTSVRALLRRDF